MKAIDKELGIEECTRINDSWYQQVEVSDRELKTAVHELQNILDGVQLMEVDQTPEFLILENNPESDIPSSYNIFDSRMPELLNEEGAPDSPVTSREDKMLDTLVEGGFS